MNVNVSVTIDTTNVTIVEDTYKVNISTGSIFGISHSVVLDIRHNPVISVINTSFSQLLHNFVYDSVTLSLPSGLIIKCYV